MTAAAHAYELPPHTSVPADAVEAAEGGEIVYLTRAGRRVAAIVPPGVDGVRELEDLAEFWRRREEETALDCRSLWDSARDADAVTRQRVREVIDRVMEMVEDAADIAAANAARARLRAGEPTIPQEQLMAEYAADLAAYPA